MKITTNYLSLNNTYSYRHNDILPSKTQYAPLKNSDVCSKEAVKCLKSLTFGSSRSEFLRQIEKKNEYVENTFLKKAKNYARETQEVIMMSEQMHTNHSGYEQIIYGRDMYGDIVKEYVVTKDPKAVNTLCVDDMTEDRKGVFQDGKLIEYQEGICDEDGEVFTRRVLLLNGNKPDSYSENELYIQDEDSGDFTLKSDFELLYDEKGALSNCFINPVRYNSIDYYPDDFEYNVVYSDDKPLYICNSFS